MSNDETMTRKERLKLLKQIEKDIHVCSLESTLVDDMKSCAIHSVIEELAQQLKNPGEVSDGYHTFNQLYHQRAILFATIVNQNKDVAWKSYKHSDGKYCFDSSGEWFIVGVDTPKGSYTYHYSKEYWDYFDCRELDCGKEWDGHTEEDVTRLLSLSKGYFEDAFMNKPCVSVGVCEHDKLEALNHLRSKIVSYRLTVSNAIEEDELKIEGMKEAYTDYIGMIDEYISEMEGNK